MAAERGTKDTGVQDTVPIHGAAVHLADPAHQLHQLGTGHPERGYRGRAVCGLGAVVLLVPAELVDVSAAAAGGGGDRIDAEQHALDRAALAGRTGESARRGCESAAAAVSVSEVGRSSPWVSTCLVRVICE